MHPILVLEKEECFSSYGTIEKPEQLEKIQRQCEHDIVLEKEGLYEISQYECMLCAKKFEGYPSMGKLPENAYILPNKPLPHRNLIYKKLIKELALQNKTIASIDIVRIIKELEPTIIELDRTINKSVYSKDLDNISNADFSSTNIEQANSSTLKKILVKEKIEK